MFDLSRITEFAAGFLGQNADNVDVEAVLQQLADQGVDPAQLQDIGADQLMSLLAENGIDPSELGAEQLGAIAENFGAAEQLPEWMSQFTDRAA